MDLQLVSRWLSKSLAEMVLIVFAVIHLDWGVYVICALLVGEIGLTFLQVAEFEMRERLFNGTSELGDFLAPGVAAGVAAIPLGYNGYTWCAIVTVAHLLSRVRFYFRMKNWWEKVS